MARPDLVPGGPLRGCMTSGDPCDDGVSCTEDSCDEANDSCSSVPNGCLCAGNEGCQGTVYCNPFAGCVALPSGETRNPCDDGIALTIDVCTPAQLQCACSHRIVPIGD